MKLALMGIGLAVIPVMAVFAKTKKCLPKARVSSFRSCVARSCALMPIK
jgi:hypothetical protein